MSAVAIVVDYRETELTRYFQQFAKEDIEVRIENLKYGDVHIVAAAAKTLVFERKSFVDLASSIKDGRYKEQKSRMMSHHAPREITYIIEEMPSPKIFTNSNMLNMLGLSASTYMGFVTHTMYRDGIHVILSDSTEDTAHWIWMCAVKVRDNPSKFVAAAADADVQQQYHQCIKLKDKKIENIDPHQCYIMQLCQIPYVSSVLATSIASAYPSLQALYSTLGAMDTQAKIASLTALPKIGAKKAATIVAYLFPT